MSISIPLPSAFKRLHWPLIVSATLLLAVGFFFVWSAESFQLAGKQLVTALVGLGLAIGIGMLDYRKVLPYAYWVYGAGLLSLLLLPVFGVTINNCRRWYNLKFFLLQPSEFMKLLTILALAKYYCYRRGKKTFGVLLIPLAIVLLPVGLIAKQPDLGTALIFVPVFFAISFAAGTRVRNLGLIAALGAAMFVAAFLVPGVLKSYQKKRILSFLYPNAPENLDASYNVRQAMVAVANGGVLGQGWGRGTLNRLNRLPVKYADFIFAVIAEEWGLLRTSLFILLYLFFLACAYRTGVITREPFGKWIVTGVMTWFAVQAFLHMGMSMRLVPVAGLPLPFISYGRSALLSNLLGLGLLISVSKHRHVVFSEADMEG